MNNNNITLSEFIQQLESHGYSYHHRGAGIRCQCPGHGGTKHNLSVDQKDGRIAMKCFSHDCSYKEIFSALGQNTEKNPPLSELSLDLPKVKSERNAQILRDLINDSFYFDKYPITDYWNNRGLDVELPGEILYVENCYHSPGKYYPAQVAVIRNVHGKIVSAHKTYIVDGYKIPKDAKKFSPSVWAGSIVGAASRLFIDDSDVLYLAEGVESAAAVYELNGKKGNVWACLSAGGMKSVHIPAGYKKVYICADNDPVGIKAAEALKLRLGGMAEILLPEHGDWLDQMLHEKGI